MQLYDFYLNLKNKTLLGRESALTEKDMKEILSNPKFFLEKFSSALENEIYDLASQGLELYSINQRERVYAASSSMEVYDISNSEPRSTIGGAHFVMNKKTKLVSLYNNND